MDATFLQERITVTKAMIIAYEDALTALAANPTTSYRLDTGQSVTQVTRSDMGSLQTTLDSLYNRLCGFENRLNGSGSMVMRPCW